ncbi:uncharacterized protein LOC129600960 [Paramacrobiotus metropolitanus]|uniref:uncharacterized protein LOC129600960 n=1 Tax=Paramacrobiotus metropolitanus TaxID=2943436 RepID=UPI002445A48A|nr:uncharacterized protein LOC129600960 [Paramacrobiotus metropolitanus]
MRLRRFVSRPFGIGVRNTLSSYSRFGYIQRNMGILSYSILAGCLIAVVRACQTEGEGCSNNIPCCSTGLTCDLRANAFGFCVKGSGGAPAGGKTTAPPKPTTTPRKPAPAATTKAPSSGTSAGYLITKEQFRQAVTANGYPAPSDEQYENINKRAFNGKITTKRELAMFLANILHESDGLRAKEEYVPIVSTDPAYPGKNFHGRGYIMLSHVYNYKDASMALYGDDRLARNPEQVAKNDQIAWDTAFWFWASRVHGQPGVAEGKFGATVKAINGGLECNGSWNEQPHNRYKMYVKILALFVPGEAPLENGCYN